MKFRLFLLFILGMVIVFLLYKRDQKPPDHSLETTLMAIDTNLVSLISIRHRSHDGRDLLIKRVEEDWIATIGNLSFKARKSIADSLLLPLTAINSLQLVPISKDRHTTLGFTDRHKIEVNLTTVDGQMESFILGKSVPAADTIPDQTYFKLGGQDQVYLVEGLLRPFFDRHFSTYRSKDFLSFEPEQIMEIGLSAGPEDILVFQKDSTGWHRQDGNQIDGEEINSWLETVSKTKGELFFDSFDQFHSSEDLVYALHLQQANTEEPLRVFVYRDSTAQRPFIFHSSQYPENDFVSDSANLYRNLIEPVLQMDTQ